MLIKLTMNTELTFPKTRSKTSKFEFHLDQGIGQKFIYIIVTVNFSSSTFTAHSQCILEHFSTIAAHSNLLQSSSVIKLGKYKGNPNQKKAPSA